MWPAGSIKLAVRIPHGRSIGPFSTVTPRAWSCAHVASTSSTVMVSCNREPASRFPTSAGAINSVAAVVLSRLMIVFPN